MDIFAAHLLGEEKPMEAGRPLVCGTGLVPERRRGQGVSGRSGAGRGGELELVQPGLGQPVALLADAEAPAVICEELGGRAAGGFLAGGGDGRVGVGGAPEVDAGEARDLRGAAGVELQVAEGAAGCGRPELGSAC